MKKNRGRKTRDTLPFNCLELCRNWEFGTGNNDGNAALSGGSSLCLSFAFQQQNFPTWRVLTSWDLGQRCHKIFDLLLFGWFCKNVKKLWRSSGNSCWLCGHVYNQKFIFLSKNKTYGKSRKQFIRQRLKKSMSGLTILTWCHVISGHMDSPVGVIIDYTDMTITMQTLCKF